MGTLIARSCGRAGVPPLGPPSPNPPSSSDVLHPRPVASLTQRRGCAPVVHVSVEVHRSTCFIAPVSPSPSTWCPAASYSNRAAGVVPKSTRDERSARRYVFRGSSINFVCFHVFYLKRGNGYRPSAPSYDLIETMLERLRFRANAVFSKISLAAPALPSYQVASTDFTGVPA